MQRIGIMCWAAILLLTTGCNTYRCLCGKRALEKQCPTDIRQANQWCFGEDAIFHCPCGPGEQFYGHQSTDWRIWPASGAEWRDFYRFTPVNVIHVEEEMPIREELLFAPPYQSPSPTSVSGEEESKVEAPASNNGGASPLLDDGAGALPSMQQPIMTNGSRRLPPLPPEHWPTMDSTLPLMSTASRGRVSHSTETAVSPETDAVHNAESAQPNSADQNLHGFTH
jgi:hypothetical protein